MSNMEANMQLNKQKLSRSGIPYTTQQRYELDKEEEQSDVLYDGITLGQWKSIRSFVIAGESKQRKKNEHIARQHFLNMRSMYKRINQINKRPNTNMNRALSAKQPQYPVPRYSKYQQFEQEMEPEVEEPEQEERVSSGKRTKITAKKPIKNEKSEQDESQNYINEYSGFDPSKKKGKTAHFPNEFEHTGERSLIEKHIGNQDDMVPEPFAPRDSKKTKQKQIEKKSESLKSSKRINKNESENENENGNENENEVEIDEEALIDKIPILKSKSEEDKNSFKEVLVELILSCELFTEEMLTKLYELTLEKNKATKESVIEKLFIEIKEFLYEQFEAMQNQAMEDENNGVNQE